jgi:hypothetical protein
MPSKLLRALRDPDAHLLFQAYLLLLLVDQGVRRFGLLPVWRLIRAEYRGPRRRGAAEAGCIERLQRAVRRAARNHLYPMNCLPQALALAWLLARHGIGVELRLGMGRDGGLPAAHAWLERDGRPLDTSVPLPDPLRPLDALRAKLYTGRPSGPGNRLAHAHL